MVSVWASARAVARGKKPPSPASARSPKPRTRFIIADSLWLARISTRSCAHCHLEPCSGQRETVFLGECLPSGGRFPLVTKGVPCQNRGDQTDSESKSSHLLLFRFPTLAC